MHNKFHNALKFSDASDILFFQGPEQEVEEWENPNLNLYKVTDRYGFMQ